MVFAFQLSLSGEKPQRLQQGEILAGILEPRPDNPGAPLQPDSPVDFTWVNHPRAIVMTPDCDLLSDFASRQASPEGTPSPHRLQHIHCCDLYAAAEIRENNALRSDLWRRVQRNQDERYHRLPPGKVDDGSDLEHPDLYLDFKRLFTLPTEFLYRCLEIETVQRLGVVPPIWIHDLIQRYFAFHSRIGVPDPEDANR